MGELSVWGKTWSIWVGCVLFAGLALFLPVAAPFSFPPETFLLVLAFVVLWIFPAGYLTQYGVSHMDVARSSILLLLELVIGAVSAHWLAGEVIEGNELVGGGLIVAGALLVALEKEVSCGQGDESGSLECRGR